METHVTPQGILSGYIALSEPRDYQDDGKFKYMFKLLIDGPDALKLAKDCDGFMQASVLAATQGKKKVQRDVAPYANVQSDDGDVIDGQLMFSFKCPATWKDGTSRQPKCYDMDGKQIEMPKRIGAGSTLRVRYAVYNREAFGKVGVTLQPVAIQIISLVERTGSSGGGDYGFDPVQPVNHDAEPPF